MTIRIESITFNHRPLTPATAALTIRKNQTVDVAVPEWRNGMTDPASSPAAYTIDQIRSNALTIKVEFTRTNSDPANVVVRAVAQTGNVFGDVVSQTINFGTGLSTVAFFTLTSVLRNPAVGIRDIAWDWFADATPLQTTRHRIYTLAGAPQPPWGQPGSRFTDFQVPWTDVLDHACREATGAQTVDEAADRLTRWVNSLGNTTLQYDENGGASHFTLNGMTTFNCTEFLRVLVGRAGTRARVNCTDCATILSSFANILGCNLIQSRIGYEFQTNLIQKIGLVYPYKQPFKFHEVAWKFPSNTDAFVYDSCLLFDGDNNVSEQPFQPTLGVNKPLGSPASESYYSRVIAPIRADRAPSERHRTRVHRKIGGQIATRAATDPVQQRLLADEYDFPSWQGTPTHDVTPPCKCHHEEQVTSSQDVLTKQKETSDQQLLLLNYSANQDGFAPSGWKLEEVKHIDAEPDPFKLTDAIWSATDCSKAKLRVLTYECSSIPAARSFVLSLLGEFDKPGIKRRQNFITEKGPVEIGDVAFADPDELVLLFARVNIVVLIQNAARQVVPVPQFAFELDADITRGPDLKGKKPQEMQQFGIPEKRIRVGDEIPMHCHSGSPKNGNGTQFNFLGSSGQVFLKGNDLLYRPLAGGEQVLTILGHNAGQQVVRQELKLCVEQPLTVQETPCKKLEIPNKEEDSIMPDVKGSWSSIRPTSDGGPTDLSNEGFMIIEEPNEAGEIRGSFVDTVNQTIEAVTGYVNWSPPEPFRLVLRHSVGDGVTREYEGQLRAIDEGEVQVVVGRYTDTRVGGPVTDAALLASQEGGIWVATKP